MSRRRAAAKKAARRNGRICRECLAGNHTGHGHQVCPRCEGRIEPGRMHICWSASVREQMK